jgi:cytosolic carboxypeptidase protein 2/3
LAGTSLIGNRLEMLTIANFEMIRKGTELPVIVILARTHAGETVSSWVMHHLIKFLVSAEPGAVALRDAFIFKLFPMVNPDGVVHGNYRCSLIGRDLNRRWKTPSKELYPEVYFIKNQIADTHEKKQIKMILDLHGHTQKRKSFFYGCADRVAPHRPRLFPYLTTKLSSFFEFSSCNFAMEKSKEATARITLYNLLKIP